MKNDPPIIEFLVLYVLFFIGANIFHTYLGKAGLFFYASIIGLIIVRVVLLNYKNKASFQSKLKNFKVSTIPNSFVNILIRIEKQFFLFIYIAIVIATIFIFNKEFYKFTDNPVLNGKSLSSWISLSKHDDESVRLNAESNLIKIYGNNKYRVKARISALEGINPKEADQIDHNLVSAIRHILMVKNLSLLSEYDEFFDLKKKTLSWISNHKNYTSSTSNAVFEYLIMNCKEEGVSYGDTVLDSEKLIDQYGHPLLKNLLNSFNNEFSSYKTISENVKTLLITISRGIQNENIIIVLDTALGKKYSLNEWVARGAYDNRKSLNDVFWEEEFSSLEFGSFHEIKIEKVKLKNIIMDMLVAVNNPSSLAILRKNVALEHLVLANDNDGIKQILGAVFENKDRNVLKQVLEKVATRIGFSRGKSTDVMIDRIRTDIFNTPNQNFHYLIDFISSERQEDSNATMNEIIGATWILLESKSDEVKLKAYNKIKPYISRLVTEKNGIKLRRYWLITKRVLLYQLVQDKLYKYVIDTFIKLGVSDVIPDLINVLWASGNKNMAEAFLNCGHGDLSKEARKWAFAHNYSIIQTTGSNFPVWGEW